jgi:hypothetical protein
MSRFVVRASATLALCAAALLAEPGSVAWRGRSAAVAVAAEELAPRAEVQDAIRQVARAHDAPELASALEEIRRITAPDHSDLVPQLAIFLLSAQGEREGMAPAVIVDRLDVSRDEIVRAVTPHLGTSNEALRAQLENLLGHDD